MCKKQVMVISHWNTMIQGVQHTPSSFYKAVEEAVKTKEIENLKYFQVYWKEGSFFSPKREYLRIRRKQHAFDICGAPFGNGFFVSWWLGEIPPCFLWPLMLTPGIGFWFEKLFRPMTYYRVDTAMMFQSLVHSAVLEVVDSLMGEQGLKALEPADRKPVMRDFFNL